MSKTTRNGLPITETRWNSWVITETRWYKKCWSCRDIAFQYFPIFRTSDNGCCDNCMDKSDLSYGRHRQAEMVLRFFPFNHGYWDENT